MSFDVFLVPSSATPGGPEARAATDGALLLCGARRAHPDQDLVLCTGEEVEFYGADDDPGGMFALRGGLSPELAQVIFEIADATACYIMAADESGAVLRTPGNSGAPLLADEDAGDEDEVAREVIPVADPAELAQRLMGGFEAWSGYRDGIGTQAPPADEPNSLLGRFWSRLTKRS
ncbi:hypothetical protein [Phenylobacterium sp.]|uniref:hypothetical protein n=1 Tax=Phenylobacterium sp. TaxID=1871053 RepID=UPI002EDAC1E9